MRVLLAGASTAIGRHLVPQLLDAGHEVIGVTSRAGSLEGTGASELVGDVTRRTGFLEVVEDVQADAIIHQPAAFADPPLAFRHLRQANRLRSEGTSTLLAAARRIGAKKFVTASTFMGYGFRDRGDDVLDESAPFGEPDKSRNDAMLRALLTNEQQVRAFGGVVLRYGLFYEPGAKDVPPVPKHWAGLLPVIHLHDAARATVLALEHGRPGEAYNIADDMAVTWRELQEMQARADGFPPPVVLPEWLFRVAAPFGAQVMTATSFRLSTEKAKQELHWQPEYPTLREGLPAALPPEPPTAEPIEEGDEAAEEPKRRRLPDSSIDTDGDPELDRR